MADYSKVLSSIEKERQIGSVLAERLKPELAFLMRARALFGDLFETIAASDLPVAGTSHSLACATLSPRVINDARVMALAIEHGYVQQAISVAAGMCDAAFALAALAGDDQRADTWLEHTELVRTSHSTRKNINAACVRVRYVKDLEQQQRHFWSIYQFLSAPKHANSVIIQQFGIASVEAERMSFRVGPHADRYAVNVGRLALLLASLVLVLAAESYRLAQAPAADALGEPINALRLEITAITDAMRMEHAKATAPPTPTPPTGFDANGIRIDG